MNSTAESIASLFLAASEGNVDAISRVVSGGVSPNVRDVFDGSTCLHTTVEIGDLPSTQRLLELGADPNLCTQNTLTSPLGMAALAGNATMVDLLLKWNAKLSESELNTNLLGECRDLGLHDIVESISRSVR